MKPIAKKRMLMALLLTLLLILALTLWIVWMPGRSYSGTTPALDPSELDLEARLRKHVAVLSNDIGGRSVSLFPKLKEAEKYVTEVLQSEGFEVRRLNYQLPTGEDVSNLEVVIPGSIPESLIIGAHYDSVLDCPGANDNATGVAGVLELARRFRTLPAEGRRTLRFVLFVNEEPPFFHTSAMGSFVYAKEMKARGEKISGMLALETIGYFSDSPNSQKYPFPFSLFYPSTGNFIGFIGNVQSGAFVRKVIGSFRRHAQIPSEGVAAPSFIPGIGWSDHAPFWNAGYSALMVTDTAPFRYPHYHQPTDTQEKLDFHRLTKVVSGLEPCIRELAQLP